MLNDDEYDHLNRKLRNLEHCALHRRTIEVTCLRCNRVRRFDAVALWWLFERRHWDDSLTDAAKRFRCSRRNHPAAERNMLMCDLYKNVQKIAIPAQYSEHGYVCLYLLN